jgi:hypothetical protein
MAVEFASGSAVVVIGVRREASMIEGFRLPRLYRNAQF